MDKKLLESIGMTSGEISVYLALLDLGISSTGKIIMKSNISSSKVYLILERLIQKGLVAQVEKNNIKHFQAANPKKLNDFMDEKKKRLEDQSKKINNLIPELQEKHKMLQEIQETAMFQGTKGFQSAKEEFVSDLIKGDEYVVFGSQEPLKIGFESSIQRFNEDNKKQGLKTRLIYNSKFKKIKKLYAKYSNVEVRFIDKILPSSIAISKSRILLMAYGENPIQVLIKNKELASSHMKFFETIWKIAKK